MLYISRHFFLFHITHVHVRQTRVPRIRMYMDMYAYPKDTSYCRVPLVPRQRTKSQYAYDVHTYNQLQSVNQSATR